MLYYKVESALCDVLICAGQVRLCVFPPFHLEQLCWTALLSCILFSGHKLITRVFRVQSVRDTLVWWCIIVSLLAILKFKCYLLNLFFKRILGEMRQDERVAGSPLLWPHNWRLAHTLKWSVCDKQIWQVWSIRPGLDLRSDAKLFGSSTLYCFICYRTLFCDDILHFLNFKISHRCVCPHPSEALTKQRGMDQALESD